MPPRFRQSRLSRRRILQLASAGAAGSIAAATAGGENPAEAPVEPPPMPAEARCNAYGYNRHPYPLPPGPHLLIDWRYVQAGAIAWLRPDSQGAPLFAHEEIPGVRGEPWRVPCGIRLEAQKAERIGTIRTPLAGGATT